MGVLFLNRMGSIAVRPGSLRREEYLRVKTTFLMDRDWGDIIGYVGIAKDVVERISWSISISSRL